MSPAPLPIRNGEAASLATVPVLALAGFRTAVLQSVAEGGRLVCLFGRATGCDNAVRLYAVVAGPAAGALTLAACDVEGSYPALTPECPQAHLFEREIAEQCGIVPDGHPWLKPVRRYNDDAAGVTDFFRVEGDEIHEVAVGPVHAGIIEPGHFRFQCHGEDVLHLEIALGYQHRGVERALVGGPGKRSVHYAETLAGDTSVGHAIAHCQAVEALAGVRVPLRAAQLRGVALELERLASHTGDLGALAGDVGYLPTASFCGRLRGDYLNMTALACGSRFGRGWIRPGGVACDLEDARAGELLQRLETVSRDTAGAVDLLWSTPSVMARFTDTGAIDAGLATELGLVGVAARACGLRRDVRFEYPAGIYCFANIPVATCRSGDVYARAHVRWEEIRHATTFIRERCGRLSDGPLRVPIAPLAPEAVVVSLVEGWRGEIAHVAMTGPDGRLAAYKAVDPSFHNWTGLAMALRGQQISDFPLCNKSFNLSYCGHDL